MSNLKITKTQWDLSPLLASDDDPKIAQYRQSITKAVDIFAKKWRDNQDYLKNPSVAKQALDELEVLERLPGNGSEGFYFGLRSAQDSIDPKVKAKDNQATEFSKEIFNKLHFFWLRLGKIAPATQKQFLSIVELEPYRHVLERTFIEARYSLSEPEEKIMTLKSSVAYYNWAQMVEDFLSKAEYKVLHEDGSTKLATQETMMTLTDSHQSRVRDSSGKALDTLFTEYSSLAEVELNSILANKKIDDELRGYKRPDESRHVSDDIDSDVVDAMLRAVSKQNHLAQRFYELKTKLLKLPRLRYHERNMAYGDIDKDYTFEEASMLVKDVFSELDPEFSAIFKEFLKRGYIDVYPKKGKRTGAFCASYHITHPIYVLLNFTGKLSDVTTLAHEMGHAINAALMKQKQNALNYDVPMSTAEVASTFMEDFIIERLAVGASDELKLALMVSQLDKAVATIFRQVACYQFEQDLHERYRQEGYLTADTINGFFKKRMSAYMGPASEGCENWWVYWSHIRNFFYVYSYVSGLLISKAMQSKVRQDKQAINQVKTFLSAGLSKSPKAIFGDMGIDIAEPEFWQQGINEIEQLLNETESLAKKLGKI